MSEYLGDMIIGRERQDTRIDGADGRDGIEDAEELNCHSARESSLV